jgi:hypothetical protein
MRPSSTFSRSFLSFIPVAAPLVLAGLFLARCSEPEADSNACPDDSTQILLTAPKGGETFHVGDSLRVKWKLCNAGPNEINAVDLLLSPDSGGTWCYMRVNSMPLGDAHFGDYAWKIPDSIGLQGEWFQLKNNARCRIRVEQYSTSDPKQRSTSGIFTIR